MRSLPSKFVVKNVAHVVMTCWKTSVNIAQKFRHLSEQTAEIFLPTYVPVILQLMYPQVEVSESS